MNPIKHPSNTRELGAPKGWNEALPVEPLGITDQLISGVPCVWSFWTPDADELAAINAGNPVILSIVGTTMPPALLLVAADHPPAVQRPATVPAAVERDALTHAGNVLRDACHGASVKAGWWTNAAAGIDLTALVRGENFCHTDKLLAGALVAQKLCLVHSEISEAMEGHRKGLMDDKLPHRSMIEVELADAVIRIADLAGAMGLDLGGAIAEKMAFNAVRPDHKAEVRQAMGGKAY